MVAGCSTPQDGEHSAPIISEMNDESFVNASSFLDASENWARESLHEYGYSDSFIDQWIRFDNGLDFATALELLTSEDDCKLLLIQRIQELRDQLSNDDQSPIDWIAEGHLIARLELTGSWNEIKENWFSDLQRGNQKGRRKRTDVAERAVAYILRKATGEGSGMDRFRHYVCGDWCRLRGKNIDIEVTPIENDDFTKVIKYRFFDNETFECKVIKEATVRGIIRRLNKKSTEKEDDDPNTGKVS